MTHLSLAAQHVPTHDMLAASPVSWMSLLICSPWLLVAQAFAYCARSRADQAVFTL